DPTTEERFARARRVRGPVPIADVVPALDDVEPHLKRLIDAGLSKFVLIPVTPPDDWDAELADVRDAALSLQT
ncbi:MAG TPA: hypothetical protein VH912_31525, partial [Streptosporangiaceae bacterium]